jgi:hypothetical protein
MGAVTIDSAGWNRIFGRAFTILLAPFGFAGLLMIIGAAMLKRTRRAGRITATVGASLLAAGAAVFAVLWLDRIGRCVEGGSFCTDRLVEGGALLLYAIAHIGLIVLIWRARRGELSAQS